MSGYRDEHAATRLEQLVDLVEQPLVVRDMLEHLESENGPELGSRWVKGVQAGPQQPRPRSRGKVGQTPGGVADRRRREVRPDDVPEPLPGQLLEHAAGAEAELEHRLLLVEAGEEASHQVQPEEEAGRGE